MEYTSTNFGPSPPYSLFEEPQSSSSSFSPLTQPSAYVGDTTDAPSDFNSSEWRTSSYQATTPRSSNIMSEFNSSPPPLPIRSSYDGRSSRENSTSTRRNRPGSYVPPLDLSSPQSPTSPRSRPQVPRKPSTLQRNTTGTQQQAADINAQRSSIGFNKSDIVIAVMGVTGAGKSTFINLLVEESLKIGHGLQSCTSEVGVYDFNYGGSRVFLVDTPGFDDTNRSDSEILKDVAFWLAAAYSNKAKLAGIIYLHRISDVRMQGSALRNLRMFKQLCGQNNLDSVVLVTTHWTNAEGARIPEAVGSERIKELVQTDGFWGGMVERGSKVLRHDGSRESALDIVASLVNRSVRVVLDIQKQLIDQQMNLDDTDAAQALQEELIKERRAFQERLYELKEDMEFAMQENDQKWLSQIERDQQKFEEKIRKTYQETEALKTNLKKIAEEKDAQHKALLKQMAEQQQQYEQQMRDTVNKMENLQAESRRREEANERQRQEYAIRAERERREHAETLQKTERRLQAEKDEAIRRQIQVEREAAERRHQQQLEAEEAREREREARWERQRQEDREWYAHLQEEQRQIAARERELERRATKKSGCVIS
ncbi:hypothetical protein TWF694_006504 [Orbilia ellipsospora]|uniref:G domain-containing protein n=1 Tax=Orbilia ellipsospora TaxID=2528407 RepID=A0AAV9XLY6_9PEZI